MQVNIKRDWLNKFVSASIADIKQEEYTELIFCLRKRLEECEKKLETFQAEELKKYIPSIEKEIEHLNKLIAIMEG